MIAKTLKTFIDPEDEGMVDIFTKPDKKFYVKSIAQEYSFYLTGTIEEPSAYSDWFQVIRNAGPNDLITIYINSLGGSASTALQFIQALKETDATIQVNVDGDCASAATMIFLQADSITICDHATFMFHNYRGMISGKGGEMLDSITYEKKWSEKLLREIYKDFLTSIEIDSILANKDIYMDKSEVLLRLDKKIKEMKKLKASK